MKRQTRVDFLWILLLLALIFSLLHNYGCGAFYTAPRWSPYIGCPVHELELHWGPSVDCSYYVGLGIKQCWYSRCVWTGMILNHYDPVDATNYLITMKDEEITDISYH